MTRADPWVRTLAGQVEVTLVRDDKPAFTPRTGVRNAQDQPCLAGTAVTYPVPLRAVA